MGVDLIWPILPRIRKTGLVPYWHCCLSTTWTTLLLFRFFYRRHCEQQHSVVTCTNCSMAFWGIKNLKQHLKSCHNVAWGYQPLKAKAKASNSNAPNSKAPNSKASKPNIILKAKLVDPCMNLASVSILEPTQWSEIRENVALGKRIPRKLLSIS